MEQNQAENEIRGEIDMQAAIVTGASSGIGLAIAGTLCELGYRVYGFGRNFEREEVRNLIAA